MTKQNEDDIKTLPGEGDVILTLDGEEVVLKPTLSACLTISRMNNGIRNTLNRVMELDFDTLVKVIAAGIGKPVTKELQEAVYKTGVYVVGTPVMRFITVINNGGRPPVERDDNEGREDNEDLENPLMNDLPL